MSKINTISRADSGNNCLGIALNDSFIYSEDTPTGEHFEKFIECIEESGSPENWVGGKVVQWWEWVSERIDKQIPAVDLSHEIFREPLTRDSLKQLCQNTDISDGTCTVAILAWGGQRRNHGVTTFQQFEHIQPIIRSMREKEVTTLEAYSKFHNLWVNKIIKGLGAAFFTKLIFFCEPSHTGFIMDQWTAKSVNLIANERFIQLSAQGYVTNQNTPDTYHRFCLAIDQIGSIIEKSGEEVEMNLFSGGGRNPMCWRKYVREVY